MPFMRATEGHVALFWDESFLWGLLGCRTLARLSIPFDVVTAEDIRKQGLSAYDILLVPGGWARDKSDALGVEGREEVRGFIRKGGSYLGFCGGAGLALDSADGLSLIPVSRKPSGERVPSFSGRIRVVPSCREHPLWKGLQEPVSFHAWWPGQFSLDQGEGITVIARYGKPEADFCVSDLVAEDIEGYGDPWERWERSYGIHLNPGRLEGEPAILDARYGEGRVLLSYLHLETPEDPQGNRALVNLCGELAEGRSGRARGTRRRDPGSSVRPWAPIIEDRVIDTVRELETAAEGLIAFGQRNFLWYWRNSWLLQWRRGIRGLEYGMIYLLIQEISHRLTEMKAMGKIAPAPDRKLDETLGEEVALLREIGLPFFEEAKRLLMEERYAMSHGPLNPARGEDPSIQQLRKKLFSSARRFGGDFKQLLDLLDAVLLGLIRWRRR